MLNNRAAILRSANFIEPARGRCDQSSAISSGLTGTMPPRLAGPVPVISRTSPQPPAKPNFTSPLGTNAPASDCVEDGDSRSRLVLRVEPKAHLVFIEIPVKRLHGSRRDISGSRSTSDACLDPLVEG
jgi:hypothetical protein